MLLKSPKWFIFSYRNTFIYKITKSKSQKKQINSNFSISKLISPVVCPNFKFPVSNFFGYCDLFGICILMFVISRLFMASKTSIIHSWVMTNLTGFRFIHCSVRMHPTIVKKFTCPIRHIVIHRHDHFDFMTASAITD